MLEKTMHFHKVDLAGDTLRRDIPRYQKQQFVHVILNGQPTTCNFIEKVTPVYIFFRAF